MYRFEIHCEEGPDKGTRYSWELLLSTGGDREEVVVGSRPFPSRAEAESEVHAFRREVAQARVEEPRACSPNPEPQAVTFRRVPNVASLPVNVSRRHDPDAAEAGSGRRHPRVPTVAEAPEAQADAEAQAEAEVGAQVALEAHAESEPPVARSRRRPTGARTPPAGGGQTSETM